MAKSASYYCTACGYETGKWLGRCPSCGAWNTFEERPALAAGAAKTGRHAAAQAAPAAALPLDQIRPDGAARLKTGLGELDRVLGGGLVKGSVVLLGGDPGIGKSTLLLQVCDALGTHGPVLYATGEESAAQIRLRAQRLGIQGRGLFVAAETDLGAILAAAQEKGCHTLIVDSIQTVYRPELPNSAGSVTQIREATSLLTRAAKQTGMTVVIVGHVTKEGALAGPRLLEHLVDAVLYFEGDRFDSFRILRAVKNRFGSTNEIGLFTMGERGMEESPDPSALFLPEREQEVPGCAVFCTIEGSRPVLAELQALAAKTVFGNPRRATTGLDYNRLTMLIAVLERKLGVSLGDQDVYVNIAGGLRVEERAADLACVAALYSSVKNLPVPKKTALFGEIGLTGEVRAVAAADKRAAECAKLGFERIILPKGNRAGISLPVEVVGVATAAEALRALF